MLPPDPKQILSYFGWTFVSMIVSDDDFEARLGANSFKTIADATGICVSQEIKVVSLTTTIEATKNQVRIVK